MERKDLYRVLNRTPGQEEFFNREFVFSARKYRRILNRIVLEGSVKDFVPRFLMPGGIFCTADVTDHKLTQDVRNFQYYLVIGYSVKRVADDLKLVLDVRKLKAVAKT